MEDFSLLQRIQLEFLKPPNNLLFMAGYLQIKTQLNSDFLFNLLSKIYSGDLDPDILRKIEINLINCNLAEVKNILASQSRCMMCKMSSDDLVCIECLHYFHRECLFKHVFGQLEKTIGANCPICNEEIKNFQSIDPRIQVLYHEKIKKKLKNSSFEIICCQRCGEVFEKMGKGPQECSVCKGYLI